MRILVTYASAGAGHRKAAEALYHSIKKNSSHEVILSDALDHTYPLYKKLYSGTYSFLITHLPYVWGFFFMLVDIPWLQPLVRGFRRVYNRINGRHFHEYLISEHFDYIFSTHFFPNEVAGSLKRTGKINSKVVSVITDYDVHRIWLAEGIDVYAVASEFTKEKCKHLGVVERQIVVTGIPTHEVFAQGYDVIALKKKLGVAKDTFTVLIATGSFGIGPIEQIIKELHDFQILVICGHNRKLHKKLGDLKRDNLYIYGFVDNMHELMAISDCMVTKPGGLSITEALVSQLPLIFFNAIPGQEKNNVKVLKSYGVGISDCSIKEIGEELRRLRASKDAYRSALNKAKELSRPQAARDIRALIV